MIGNLASLTASQRAVFQRFQQAPTREPENTVVDTVSCDPQAKFRPPAEAVSFMADFDAQLGISSEMRDEKRKLMAEDSHSFFRASPALFYHDLKTTYRNSARLLNQPSPTVAILGDAHTKNAGTFRGPDGKTVWGLNDFDQAENGPAEWDLERLGVSLYVAARGEGESPCDALKLVERMGRSYIDHLGEEGPSYFHEKEVSGPIDDLIEEAESVSQDDLLEKWTTDGKTRLKRDDKLMEIDGNRGRKVQQALEQTFPDYKFLDTASKPHSGGSTRGLERYYSLVTSPDRKEPWLLETKAVLPSPVQIADGDLGRGDGAKVLHFWKEMGGHTDERHRSFRLGNVAYFTREREKEKDSLKESPENLEASAGALGQLLARAHSRSGADIRGWIGNQEDKFLSKLMRFSRTYARQVESDFREWQSRYG